MLLISNEIFLLRSILMGFGWRRNGSSRRTDCQAIKEQRKGAAWNMRRGIAAFYHKNPGKLLVFPATKNSVICHRKKIVCRLLILSKSRSLIDTTVNKQKSLQ